MISNKICVVGWYFFPELYKFLYKYHKDDVYIIAHRYNKILDDLKLNYTITENIGLEFGAYDYYIKNIWDKKSNVLFMHDDTKIVNKKIMNKVFKKCNTIDYSYILSDDRKKSQGKSYRCFYLSRKVIKLFIKEFNGIWYDRYNRGYIMAEKKIYEKRYTKKYIKESQGLGRQLKTTLLYLQDKYNLIKGVFNIKGFYFFRRGTEKGYVDNYLIDNSIFNRKGDNRLEDNAIKIENKKNRKYNYYTKWYDYYLNSIRMDKLNILEIGISKKQDLEIWEKYFVNSNIYGISKNISNCNNIFCIDDISEDIIVELSKNVKNGFDIIIDNGGYDISIKIFEQLFSGLNNWGIYVVEDLHRDCDRNKIIIDFLKNCISDINCNGKFKNINLENNIKEESLKKYEKCISAINFHPGICFIVKRFLGIGFD